MVELIALRRVTPRSAAKRSVFSEQEIAARTDTNGKPIKVLDFMLVKHLDKPIGLIDLLEKGSDNAKRQIKELQEKLATKSAAAPTSPRSVRSDLRPATSSAAVLEKKISVSFQSSLLTLIQLNCHTFFLKT